MLIIYFRDELYETAHGFSPSGAVFYYELIKKVDLESKVLYLIDPVDIGERGELVSFKFEVDDPNRTLIVYIHKKKILRYARLSYNLEKTVKQTFFFTALDSDDILLNFKYLVAELKEDGMKKKDIARLFGVNYRVLRSWENGKKIFNDVERLILIEKILEYATALYDISPSRFLLETKLNCSVGEKSIVELLEAGEIELMKKLRDDLINELDWGCL